MSFFAGVAQAVKEWDEQKYNTKERESRQAFQTSERVAGQEFSSSEAEISRKHDWEKLRESQEFALKETAAGREYDWKKFTAGNQFTLDQDLSQHLLKKEIISIDQANAISMFGLTSAFEKGLIDDKRMNAIELETMRHNWAVDLQNSDLQFRRDLAESGYRHERDMFGLQKEESRWLAGYEILTSKMDAARELSAVQAERISQGASLLQGNREVAATLEASGQLEGLIETITIASKNGNLDPNFVPSVLSAVTEYYGNDLEATAKAMVSALKQPRRYVGPKGEEALLAQVLAMSSADLMEVRPVATTGPSVTPAPLPNQTAHTWSVEELNGMKRMLTQEFTQLGSLSISDEGSTIPYVAVKGADPLQASLERAIVNASASKVRDLMGEITQEDAVSLVSYMVNSAMLDDRPLDEVLGIVASITPESVYTVETDTGTDTETSDDGYDGPPGYDNTLGDTPEGTTDEVASAINSLKDQRQEILDQPTPGKIGAQYRRLSDIQEIEDKIRRLESGDLTVLEDM